MSDTQSMPQVDLAYRIPCFQIAIPIALKSTRWRPSAPRRAFGLDAARYRCYWIGVTCHASVGACRMETNPES